MSSQNNNVLVLYDVTLDKLKSQVNRIDSIDSKVGITFGLANGLLVTLLGFVVVIDRPVALLVQVFITASIIAYLVSLLLLVKAYYTSHWDYGPDPDKLREICIDPKYRNYPDIVKEWIVDECIRAYEYNRKHIAGKASKASWAIVTLGAQAITFALAGVVTINY